MAHTVDKFTKIIADLRDSSRNVKNSGVAGYESTEKIDNGLVLFLLCDEQGNLTPEIGDIITFGGKEFQIGASSRSPRPRYRGDCLYSRRRSLERL
jgi:hypothetical protein